MSGRNLRQLYAETFWFPCTCVFGMMALGVLIAFLETGLKTGRWFEFGIVRKLGHYVKDNIDSLSTLDALPSEDPAGPPRIVGKTRGLSSKGAVLDLLKDLPHAG